MDDPSLPVRQVVRERLASAWRLVATDGSGDDPAEVSVEVTRPADPAHGDLSTNLCLKLARPMRRPPMELASALEAALRADGALDPDGPLSEVAATPPGFVNLRLSPAYLEHAIDSARSRGPAFGQVAAAQPERINVEFVSANPTGPLTVGNARGAFVGDLLSRVLEAAGHEITREYYFNDSGGQIDVLGASVAALRAGQPLPEEAYRGAYVADLARQVPDEVWARAMEPGIDRDATVGRWAAAIVRAGIEASLERLGVDFDVWTSERTLVDDGWVARAVERLRVAGYVFEQDGATWFRSTTLGDDRDRVIFRSSGEPTYFAKDIGYVTEKFSRGFDRLIYIWGQDHHGTVARNRNAAQAMGYDREKVQMLLVAWVRFVRDGQDISMSKRAGEFITLDELLSEVGVDAARWSFGSKSPNTPIDFDIELAKKQSAENPVYYVQYAHARIRSILRKATDVGLQPADSMAGTLGSDEVAQGLARHILRLPEVIEDAAAAQETHGITAYATELATALHAYYRDRRVVDVADRATSGARLALVDAARLSLANSLALLGISAPESM